MHALRIRRRVWSGSAADASTRLVLTDALRNLGTLRPPHSRFRTKTGAATPELCRTKQTARKEIAGKRAQRRRDIAALPQPAFAAIAGGADAPPELVDLVDGDDGDILAPVEATPPPAKAAVLSPPPKPTKRRRGHRWSGPPGTKASRAAAAGKRTRRVQFPSPELPELTQPAIFASDVSPPTSSDEAAAKKTEDTLANRNSAAMSIAVMMGCRVYRPRVAADDTAPQRLVRSRYGWDGGSTTMHYPNPVRVPLGYVAAEEIATNLVNADTRIPDVTPPASIRNMNALVAYHKARAETIKKLLVEVTAAYNMATDGPHRTLPIPPVQHDTGVVVDSGVDSDVDWSEEL